MRRSLEVSIALLFLSVAALADSGHVSAQVAPADSAAVLLQAATHFEASGQPDVAQSIYRLIADRFGDTAAAAEARARLTTVRAAGTTGSGKVELQVWSTLYGLWLGIAVPGALGADDSEPYGVGLLAGGPAGFLAGRVLSRGGTITEGQARAITLGGSWGTWQGFGWTEILDLGTEDVCYSDPVYGRSCYADTNDGEEKFAGMILGGIAGIAAGVALSRGDVSPGVATAANFGALWGSWIGFATGYLADLEDDGLLAAALLGGNAGLASVALVAPRNVSRSRARLVSIYGVIGGLSGLGMDLLTQPDNEKVAVGVPLAGSLIGLGIGLGTTRDFDDAPSGGQGAPGLGLVNLSNGEWSLGTPVPLPRMLELDGPRGLMRKPALGFTLLNARFF
ncbi:MAG TPA: hypothetical protein VLA36_02840 [Longimicrobiales bacterium]|nr:hypothetical protein [Longimicrobiales bacterium]